jgi:hypothetical protein
MAASCNFDEQGLFKKDLYIFTIGGRIMKLKRLLAMLLTLCMVLTLLPGVAMAKGVGATIYVAANGSDDNPGTEESPYANIQKAVNVANDGDTIIVKEGSYNVWCPTS